MTNPIGESTEANIGVEVIVESNAWTLSIFGMRHNLDAES